MSKERSPLDVCSITIGISGLTCAPRVVRLARAGGPDRRRLGALLRSFLLGRPQLLLRVRLLGRDRLGVLGDDVERLLRRQIEPKRGQRGRVTGQTLDRGLDVLV